MMIYDQEGKRISIGAVVGRGGEAVVYRVDGRPGWLAKIYEPAPRPNYAAKLAWMLEHPPANPTRALNHPSLAWPAGLLYGPGNRLAGYLMPYIQQAVPVLVVFNPRRRAENLAQFDRRYLHRAARNLATAAGALHKSGYVVGDLNESNILVTPSALVSLIDTDSFQVQELRGSNMLTYACPVGKPEYTPPELQGKSLSSLIRSPEQDAFSLGVLIFQLLMEGNHPFRAQWLGKGDPPPIEERIALGGFPYTSTPGVPVRPPRYAPDLDLLHPEISELVRRCFIDGYRDPRQRPEASAWEYTIAEAEKALVQCPKGHFYSGHMRACPACYPPRGPARGPTWPTSPASRPAPASHPAGSNPPAGQRTAAKGTKPSAAPATSKPTSQQAANQTHTSSRTTISSAKNPSHAAAAGSPPPAAGTSNIPPGHVTGAAASNQQPLSGGKTSKRRPAWRVFPGSPPPGPNGPPATPSPANAAASGFKQALQMWETYKYWQAQQAQTKQAPPGSGLKGNHKVGQIKAAWKTWKFWQAQQSQALPQTQQPQAQQSKAQQSQAQQPPQAPSKAAQPPPSRKAHAQPAPGSAGTAQMSNPAAPLTGAGSAQQTQPPTAHTAQNQQNSGGVGNPSPQAAQASSQSTQAHKAQAQSGQGQQTKPSPSRPAAQPAQPQTPVSGSRQAAPPYSQPPRSAPHSTSPQPGKPAYSRSAAVQAQPGNGILNWAGPRLYKSLAIGGGVGALAGALPGALVGVAGWSAGSMTPWVFLWALGGAAAGLLRGWEPGYRMSLRIDQVIGWQRVCPAIGLAAGAALGGFIGFVLGWWAIIPVFVGLALGAWLGLKAGHKLWQAGARFGWERIWAGVGAVSAALIGWRIAAWLGAGSLSIHLAGSLSAWVTSQFTSLVLVSLVIGALGGALGGAVSGTMADLFARILKLLD